jgi:hypothetical protein
MKLVEDESNDDLAFTSGIILDKDKKDYNQKGSGVSKGDMKIDLPKPNNESSNLHAENTTEASETNVDSNLDLTPKTTTKNTIPSINLDLLYPSKETQFTLKIDVADNTPRNECSDPLSQLERLSFGALPNPLGMVSMDANKSAPALNTMEVNRRDLPKVKSAFLVPESKSSNALGVTNENSEGLVRRLSNLFKPPSNQ